ncbi:hypothetical protein CEXT_36981 [Caerostris extrusa]|uniref:Uncharacterized protein n=1 Tax=Caerostris extrusa TaxID=172846 RepID=A0AAV4ULT9_CAEEX|nr:hypothetical protein CEXT_36981 [Caerostris extrusa]
MEMKLGECLETNTVTAEDNHEITQQHHNGLLDIMAVALPSALITVLPNVRFRPCHVSTHFAPMTIHLLKRQEAIGMRRWKV